MATPQVIWHGTKEEAERFTQALASDCTCNTKQNKKVVCPSHFAMLHDQKFVDRLLFYLYISDRLKKEEWAERKTS